MTLYILSSLNKDMLKYWIELFKDIKEVKVQEGNFFRTKVDAMVSPANSRGWMTGGLDLNISFFFDPNSEKIAKKQGISLYEFVEKYCTELNKFKNELDWKIQKIVQKATNGFLPVGKAEIVETLDEKIPYLISAPTMEIPRNIRNTDYVYKAFKAILQAVENHNNSKQNINSVICPGLGTGAGMMPHKKAAKQMWQAYKEFYDLE